MLFSKTAWYDKTTRGFELIAIKGGEEMRKAKGLSFLLALMLLVTTACSSDPGSASSGGGSQSVSTESNPSGSSTPSESEQVTLNIILMETAFVQALEPLIPEFEQEFGIKVNYEVGGQEIQRQRMYLDLSGESGQIDVVHLSNSYVQDWVRTINGAELQSVTVDGKAIDLSTLIKDGGSYKLIDTNVNADIDLVITTK